MPAAAPLERERPVVSGLGTQTTGRSVRIIVRDFGLSVNDYAQLGRDVPVYEPDACPGCGLKGRLVGHGLRERGVWLLALAVVVIIYVRRLRCSRARGGCGGVFTVLPGFVHPYKRYALEVAQPIVMQRFLNHLSFLKLATTVDGPAPSTQRNWARSFQRAAGAWLEQVAHRWARWIPEMALPRQVESGAPAGLLACAALCLDDVRAELGLGPVKESELLSSLWSWGAERLDRLLFPPT